MARALAVIGALAVAGSTVGGCAVAVPEGRLACDADGDCPSGWSCVAMRCYASARDAGVADARAEEMDASPSDAAPSDAAPSDAASSSDAALEDAALGDACAGTSCAGECVDVTRDARHCGECGMACPAPPTGMVSVCRAGSCSARCAPGFVPAPDGVSCGRDCTRLACGTAPPPECGGSPGCLSVSVYTAVWIELEGCVSTSWRDAASGLACTAAADRWCRAHAGEGWLGGFGPVGQGADGAPQVVCVASAVMLRRALGFDALGASSGGCTATTAAGGECLEAADDHCATLYGLPGAGAGYGAIASAGSTLDLACFPPALVVDVAAVDQSVLARAGCDPSTAAGRRSLACLAVVNAECIGASAPHVAAVGPYVVDGSIDDVRYSCLLAR